MLSETFQSSRDDTPGLLLERGSSGNAALAERVSQAFVGECNAADERKEHWKNAGGFLEECFQNAERSEDEKLA